MVPTSSTLATTAGSYSSRALDQLDSVPLGGADFPRNVFIKPDGQWVGFVGEFVLRKAAINGGAVQNLLNLGARALLGATWGGNGTIIFATEAASTGLEQISENGGATTVLTRPNRENGEEDHAWPAFLPGGQAVLFTITAAGGINNAAIAVLDLRPARRRSSSVAAARLDTCRVATWSTPRPVRFAQWPLI